MLFLMVVLFSKDGIKIELFPTDFKKQYFIEKCQQMHKNWLCARGTPPFVQQLVWGDISSHLQSFSIFRYTSP